MDPDHEMQCMNPPKGGPRWLQKMRSVVTVEVVMFLYFLGSTSYLPALQQYVHARISQEQGFVKETQGDNGGCGQLKQTTEYTAMAGKVQSDSSHFMMLVNALYLIPSMFTTLFLGHYSDKAGRKLVLLPALLGGTLRSVITLTVSYFQADIYWLLLAGVVDSCTGGKVAILMGAFAYISDISTRESRTIRMVLVEASLGGGAIVASLITGFAIQELGYDYTFLIGVVAHTLNTIYVVFYLKETIIPKGPVRFFTLEHVKSSFRLFFGNSHKAVGRKLQLCALFMLFFYMVEVGSNDVVMFYLLGQPLCFNSVQVGIYNAISLTLKFLGGMVVVKLLRMRLSDTAVLIVAGSAGIASQILFGFAVTPVLVMIVLNGFVLFLLVPLVMTVQTLGMPVVRAVASIAVSKEQLGSLFAALSLTQQFSMFVGYTMFDAIFASTVSIYPGFVFFVCAAQFAIAAAIAIVLHIKDRKELHPVEFVNDIGDIKSVNEDVKTINP